MPFCKAMIFTSIIIWVNNHGLVASPKGSALNCRLLPLYANLRYFRSCTLTGMCKKASDRSIDTVQSFSWIAVRMDSGVSMWKLGIHSMVFKTERSIIGRHLLSPLETCDCNSPESLGVQILLPDTVKPNSGSPSGSATKQKSAKATKIKYLSQKPQISRSSRLDLIKRSIQAKGFSENTARCITKSVRGSTNAIYNSKWGIFEAWCCKRKIDPVKVSIHRIADFLTEKREGGLSATTIEGYRSAISNTLKHTSGLDLGLDSYISALLRSFRLEDTKRRNPSPPWDLSLVLTVLRSKPFEPIRSISMKNLTLKTVFLLALASGKRRSELHALSRAGVLE